MNEANGAVLETLGTKIEIALKDPKLRKTDRAILEIQQLFILYLKSDHEKLADIYPFSKKQMEKAATADKDDKDDRIFLRRQFYGAAIGTLVGSGVTALIGWAAYAFQIEPILKALTEAAK